MIKKTIAISLLAFTSISQAGFNGLTFHSRASCVNNESITWDAKKAHHLETTSNHYKWNKYYNQLDLQHQLKTKSEITRRSAAVHWGEGSKGWHVEGIHRIIDDKTGKYNEYTWTLSDDCSKYDGWWDWNP